MSQTVSQTQRDDVAAALVASTYTLPQATLKGNGASWVVNLVGTTGNDVFDPGPGVGSSTMTANGGNDVFYIRTGADKVVLSSAAGSSATFIDLGMSNYTLPLGVANLVGAASAPMTLVGNAQNNIIRANGYDDTIDGGAGADTLVGGAGRDTFIETKGNGSDTIVNFQTGANADVVSLRSYALTNFAAVQGAFTQVGANAVLNLGGGETLTFLNHATTDFVAANFGLPAVVVVPGPGTATSSNSQSSSGSASQNNSVAAALVASTYTLPQATLKGNGASWVVNLVGTTGDDVFDPGPGVGSSTMTANGGNDVFYIRTGADKVVLSSAAGSSATFIDLGMSNYTLPLGVANLVGAASAPMTLVGNAQNNIIRANGYGDTIDGGAGADTLVGGAGRDTFIETKGNGSDTIVNFQTGANADVVSLRSYALTNFAAVQGAFTQVGANAVLNLGGGETLTFLNHATTDFVAANFGLPITAAVSGSGSGSQTSSNGAPATTQAPVAPQPAKPGDVVGLVLQNPTGGVLAAREITFGQEFAPGQVPAGRLLQATINGVTVPVQMDVKATNADGSVRMAVLTIEQPALAANASTGVMLSLAAAGSVQAKPVDISALTHDGYSLTVDLVLHNANGTTTPFHIDAAQALTAALKAGTASTWLSGPQATQVRVDVPVTGSLHVTFDITAYADGTTSTDVQFNNDIAMSGSGGEVHYDATIKQNGAVAFQQSNIDQFQYQTWHEVIASNGSPAVNVQHDVAALEAAGFVQDYDLGTGVATSIITGEVSSMSGSAKTVLGTPSFGILGNAGLEQYMPTTGGRPDIGPTTEADTVWLLTQNAGAAQYALAQADAAGSIPWHFYSTTTGTYVTTTQYPTLWADPRGGSSGTIGLTQQVPQYLSTTSPGSGWAVDAAHEPDTSYVAYLMTGSRYYLDQLNAEASSDILGVTPGTWLNGQDLVVNGQTQVRAQAWELRELQEAAFINPDNSALKTYFAQVVNNNFQNLLTTIIPAATAAEGQASGWLAGNYGAGTTAPWQQDYFAQVVALAAEQGNTQAKQVLHWEANYIVGRFLQAQNGFDPHDGVAYNMVLGPSTGGALYQTWAQIEQATAAAGLASSGGTWAALEYPSYRQWAMASLADDITVEQSPQAIQAFGWLAANSGITPTWEANNPSYDIVPRLSDGKLLTAGNMHYLTGTSSSTVAFGNADQLVFDLGAATARSPAARGSTSCSPAAATTCCSAVRATTTCSARPEPPRSPVAPATTGCRPAPAGRSSISARLTPRTTSLPALPPDATTCT